MVRWCGVCLLLVVLLVPFGCGGDLPKGAVAQVGQTLITQAQFDDLKSMYERAGRAPDKNGQKAEYARFEQGLAQYLVTMEVLRQEAAAAQVRVTDQDVQAEIEKIKAMFDGDENRFNEALKKQNLTLAQLTESLGDNLLLERMKAVVTGNLSVTDEEAKAYYEEHKSDFVQQEERKTSHILISPFPASGDSGTATQADWDAAQAEAEKVRGEIQNGADFANEAKKYSDDATTRDAGGQLGLITRGQMVPAFEEAVFSLKKGELSEPVKTQYGYHLILVTDIVPAKQLSYEQVAERIKSTLLSRKQDEAWRAWLASKEKELGVEYRADLRPPAVNTVSSQATDTTTTGSSVTSTDDRAGTTTSSAAR